jgi:hypothetical protein
MLVVLVVVEKQKKAQTKNREPKSSELIKRDKKDLDIIFTLNKH